MQYTQVLNYILPVVIVFSYKKEIFPHIRGKSFSGKVYKGNEKRLTSSLLFEQWMQESDFSAMIKFNKTYLSKF